MEKLTSNKNDIIMKLLVLKIMMWMNISIFCLSLYLFLPSIPQKGKREKIEKERKKWGEKDEKLKRTVEKMRKNRKEHFLDTYQFQVVFEFVICIFPDNQLVFGCNRSSYGQIFVITWNVVFFESEDRLIVLLILPFFLFLAPYF